jgi:hypothetical protein
MSLDLSRGGCRIMFLDCVSAAKLCSNAILSVDSDYGKSPCFSRSIVLNSADADDMGSPFTVLYIEVF